MSTDDLGTVAQDGELVVSAADPEAARERLADLDGGAPGDAVKVPSQRAVAAVSGQSYRVAVYHADDVHAEKFSDTATEYLSRQEAQERAVPCPACVLPPRDGVTADECVPTPDAIQDYIVGGREAVDSEERDALDSLLAGEDQDTHDTVDSPARQEAREAAGLDGDHRLTAQEGARMLHLVTANKLQATATDTVRAPPAGGVDDREAGLQPGGGMDPDYTPQAPAVPLYHESPSCSEHSPQRESERPERRDAALSGIAPCPSCVLSGPGNDIDTVADVLDAAPAFGDIPAHLRRAAETRSVSAPLSEAEQEAKERLSRLHEQDKGFPGRSMTVRTDPQPGPQGIITGTYHWDSDCEELEPETLVQRISGVDKTARDRHTAMEQGFVPCETCVIEADAP